MATRLKQIKELRDATGAGVMDAKVALEEADGDYEKARKKLVEKGLASASKRVGREAGEGVIEAYVHTGNKVGAIVELRCETDFVARTDDFRDLARNIAMQVTAMQPQYIVRESIPEGAEDVASTDVLVEQPFIKDTKVTVGEEIKRLIAKVGENIFVSEMHRLSLT